MGKEDMEKWRRKNRDEVLHDFYYSTNDRTSTKLLLGKSQFDAKAKLMKLKIPGQRDLPPGWETAKDSAPRGMTEGDLKFRVEKNTKKKIEELQHKVAVAENLKLANVSQTKAKQAVETLKKTKSASEGVFNLVFNALANKDFPQIDRNSYDKTSKKSAKCVAKCGDGFSMSRWRYYCKYCGASVHGKPCSTTVSSLRRCTNCEKIHNLSPNKAIENLRKTKSELEEAENHLLDVTTTAQKAEEDLANVQAKLKQIYSDRTQLSGSYLRRLLSPSPAARPQIDKSLPRHVRRKLVSGGRALIDRFIRESIRCEMS